MLVAMALSNLEVVSWTYKKKEEWRTDRNPTYRCHLQVKQKWKRFFFIYYYLRGTCVSTCVCLSGGCVLLCDRWVTHTHTRPDKQCLVTRVRDCSTVYNKLFYVLIDYLCHYERTDFLEWMGFLLFPNVNNGQVNRKVVALDLTVF